MLPDVSKLNIINRSTVNELMQREKDGEPLFKRLFTIYLEETPRLLTDLKASVASRDSESSYDTIHQMKGSAAAMGASRVYALTESALHSARDEGLFAEENLAGRIEAETELYIREATKLLENR